MHEGDEPGVDLIAALPWYDLPCWRGALDRCWSAMREELRRGGCAGLPLSLDRSRTPSDCWRSGGLLLSQCCGPDLQTSAGADLEPLGRPVFSDLDATPGAYFSHVVEPLRRRRRRDPRNTRIAVNAPSSRSGCLALLEWLRERETTDPSIVVSGSHAASLSLLRSGAADLAAIDAHSWDGLDTDGVRIIGRSREAPSPPWVRHVDCPVPAEHVRDALEAALRECGEMLGIAGILEADRSTYAPDTAITTATMPARDARAVRDQ